MNAEQRQEDLRCLVQERDALLDRSRRVLRALVLVNDRHAEMLGDAAPDDAAALRDAIAARQMAGEVADMLSRIGNMPFSSRPVMSLRRDGEATG